MVSEFYFTPRQKNILQQLMEAGDWVKGAEIAAAKPDFIFSTVNFEHDLPIPTIIISPFLDMKDIKLINKNLNLWEHTARQQKLCADLAQYFAEELFYSNLEFAGSLGALAADDGRTAAFGGKPRRIYLIHAFLDHQNAGGCAAGGGA